MELLLVPLGLQFRAFSTSNSHARINTTEGQLEGWRAVGSKRWDLEVAGSACGGRGFGPCSYPSGWTLNKLKSSSSSYRPFERFYMYDCSMAF